MLLFSCTTDDSDLVEDTQPQVKTFAVDGTIQLPDLDDPDDPNN